jgi:hypothetical protein
VQWFALAGCETGALMYARVTTFKVDPARVAELDSKVRDMRPRIMQIPGLAQAYAAWRADGQGVLVALYRDRAAADRAVGRLQALWGELAGLVIGVPRIETYDAAEQLTI